MPFRAGRVGRSLMWPQGLILYSAPAHDRQELHSNLRPSTKGIQLAVRGAAGAGLSIAIAQFFNLQYPIYAFIAAVIVTDLTPS